MARENFRDRALVIRSYDFGEADRVIVLLTRNHGLVRGVAKGVRRAKSRFGSRLQLFVNLDVQLYPGRNLYTISQADTVDYFGANIIEDYERYTAACAALESAERLAFTDADSDPYLYTALVHTLQVMQYDDPLQALDAFLLQAMAHAGWAPASLTARSAKSQDPTTPSTRLWAVRPATSAAHRARRRWTRRHCITCGCWRTGAPAIRPMSSVKRHTS